MATAVPVSEIRRALVRCPNWLGDTVMALPALRALRQALPHAELWCQGPWVDAILEGEPGVARRLPVPRTLRGRLALARAIRRAGVDLVVLLTSSLATALLARLTGARWRLGQAGDGRGSLLTHAVPRAGAPVHQVEAFLGLLSPVGVAAGRIAPTLPVLPERRDQARHLLAAAGIPPGAAVAGLALGSAFGPSKLWPAERLAALAGRLEAAGARVVFTGSPVEAGMLRAVQARLPRQAASLVGRDTPALLPALLAECRVVVGADSGPVHVAAAVGTPVVVLFGPTDPRLTAPIGPRHLAIWTRPPCAPCFRPRCPVDHRCLRGIGVDEVAEAAIRRLRGEA